MPHLLLCIAVACALLAGCSPTDDSSSQAGREMPAVDAARVRLEDAAAWRHRAAVDADLDGDGASERIIVTADVEVRSDGTPLWEDGHRWAVLVEDGNARTLLYGAFVPNGHVEAAITAGPTEGARHLLVLERTPQHWRVLVIAYDGPDKARTVRAASDPIERWLPPLVQR